MTPCTVTTGFFLLGRCGRPAVAACPGCGRAICAEHAVQGGYCPACAAQAGGPPDPYDPSYASGYRRRYYESSSQTYYDDQWYSSFDSHDRGAFNPGDGYSYGEGDFGPDDGDGGFVDS